MQQHYVPQFLLKNFTHGKKSQIFAFDKSNGKRFDTNIRNIAGEGGFYDLELPTGKWSIEPNLAKLEAQASRILKSIIKEPDLRAVRESDVGILATFLAVQFVRTKEHRLRFSNLTRALMEKFRETGASAENISQITENVNGASDEKLAGINAIADVEKYIPHFLNKAWLLYETSRNDPFFTSDNPLVLHNSTNHAPYGNLGLGVPRIEIYLPLSSTLCLGLLCSTIAREFDEAAEQLKVLDQSAPGLADSSLGRPVETRAFIAGYLNGTPIRVSDKSVMMMNSLQVTFSSRFVYCEHDHFDLVERMIRDNPNYREGLKPTYD